MARMKNLAIAADDTVEDFLTGKFLETMRLYGQMAGTTNPATVAADLLHAGEPATVPGEWLGPEFYGTEVRLQQGRPAMVRAVVQ